MDASKIMDLVGEPADEDLCDEMHRFSLNECALVLRRDCHGRLRRLEINFDEQRLPRVRARLGALGAVRDLVPGQLMLLDLPGVAQVHLAPTRMSAVLRLNVQRAGVQELLAACIE